MGRLTLILGGARSGKSALALRLLLEAPGEKTFVATARIEDEEMAERVRAHRKARPPEVKTLEEPLNPVRALRSADKAEGAILLDCLTLWLSNLMAEPERDDALILEEVEELARASRELQARLIVVSNEVGMGIIPEGPLARRFRDLAGRANQIMARAADEVLLAVAGIPWRLKP